MVKGERGNSISVRFVFDLCLVSPTLRPARVSVEVVLEQLQAGVCVEQVLGEFLKVPFE